MTTDRIAQLEQQQRMMLLEQRVAELTRERGTLQAQLAVVVQALEFYADPETYHACTFMFDRPTGGFDKDMEQEHGHPDYDRPMPGKLARHTLANLPAAARALLDELARVKGALRDLVEQVDSLEGYQLTRDIDPHEAQATWDDVLERVNRVCKEMK